MKYYARQIAPEWQESPLFYDFEIWPDNIAVFGNRHYIERFTGVFDGLRDNLAVLWNDWDNMRGGWLPGANWARLLSGGLARSGLPGPLWPGMAGRI